MPAKSKPSPSVPYTVHIAYRDEKGEVQRMPMKLDDAGFYADVQRWRYVVANRQRITRATRDALGNDLADWLQQRCDMKERAQFERHLRAMARAPRIEVQIPYVKEEQGYAARLFPWESALTLLTRPLREAADSQSVLRWLEVKGTKLRPAQPANALLVRSSPGALAVLYDLEGELRLVAETLGPRLQLLPQLRDPDRTALAQQLKSGPHLLHLAGVDPFALQSQGLVQTDEASGDGFVLRGTPSGFDCVPPGEMANLACSGKTPPLLLAVSSCYSAQRLAALAVGLGAQHAIGFVDTLTDADAMLFFGSFYREWASDWNIARAFDVARRNWSAQSATPNAGVVLWSRVSLLEDLPTAPPKRAREPSAPEATPADLTLSVELKRDSGWGEQRKQRTERTSLNYSLLHNDRSPFKHFRVVKPRLGPLPPLQVDVALEVGTDACRSRFSVELPETAADIDLGPRIRLPLVASLLRHCTESLRTNLYIRVQCGERLLLEDSQRVTVLPADEWRDDGEDHLWLPCFVLPRDPAVLKVIAAAQRYLRTLLDDCTAGFDGYQRLSADDSNAAEVVDPQVQAIWAALQHELPIHYINPPPSYTSQAQRLRSPSEVFRGQAATCIDLGLLFAACLEFIGIYPVLFLVEGHAFPGYWRSDKAWWGMKQFRFTDASAVADMALPLQQPAGGGQSESWMLDSRDNLAEILRYVQSGMLVPFESTYVAAQRGFFAALEEGATRLHPQTFDAMVDIQSARGANVTPLPLFDKFDS